MLLKGKQFLLHLWHPSCLRYVCYLMVSASKQLYCSLLAYIMWDTFLFNIFSLKAILMELFYGLYTLIYPYYLMGVMVFNVNFNNISVISWRSVLLVEEIGVPGKTTNLLQVTDKLDHIMLLFNIFAAKQYDWIHYNKYNWYTYMGFIYFQTMFQVTRLSKHEIISVKY